MAVVGLVGWVGLVPVNKVCMLLQWDPRVGRVSLQKGPFLLKGKGERLLLCLPQSFDGARRALEKKEERLYN